MDDPLGVSRAAEELRNEIDQVWAEATARKDLALPPDAHFASDDDVARGHRAMSGGGGRRPVALGERHAGGLHVRDHVRPAPGDPQPPRRGGRADPARAAARALARDAGRHRDRLRLGGPGGPGEAPAARPERDGARPRRAVRRLAGAARPERLGPPVHRRGEPRVRGPGRRAGGPQRRGDLRRAGTAAGQGAALGSALRCRLPRAEGRRPHRPHRLRHRPLRRADQDAGAGSAGRLPGPRVRRAGQDLPAGEPDAAHPEVHRRRSVEGRARQARRHRLAPDASSG